jgi:hypothetical protein
MESIISTGFLRDATHLPPEATLAAIFRRGAVTAVDG